MRSTTKARLALVRSAHSPLVCQSPIEVLFVEAKDPIRIPCGVCPACADRLLGGSAGKATKGMLAALKRARLQIDAPTSAPADPVLSGSIAEALAQLRCASSMTEAVSLLREIRTVLNRVTSGGDAMKVEAS